MAERRTFDLASAVRMLESMPQVLESWLSKLDEKWLLSDEGPDTFTPFDVIGHLIQGERLDWMQRIRFILEGSSWPFLDPAERRAGLEANRGRPIIDLLGELSACRGRNVETLTSLRLGAADLERTGIHPEMGEVTLREILATWVVHDLDHTGQIARIMAKRFGGDVGPWARYLPVLNRRDS